MTLLPRTLVAIAALTSMVLLDCDKGEDSRLQAIAASSTNSDDAMRIAQTFSAGEIGRGRGGGPPPADALSRVADARCDRIASCDGIGSNSLYPSRETCVQRERKRAGSWWGAQCTAVDEDRLASCLADVASDYCPATLDRPFVSSAGDCAATNVCAAP